MTPAVDSGAITTPASDAAASTAPATTATVTATPADTTPSRPKRKAATKAKDEKEESDSEEEVAPATKKPKPADEEEKRVKVVRKGRAAVDVNCSRGRNCHVLEEGDDIWDCMLNQTNIANNNNKFYVIQLLEQDGGGSYSVWNRWGRVGEIGQNMLKSCGSDLKKAKQDFMKKYKDKTANSWQDRKSFKPKTGKYTLIEIDYGAEAEVEEKKEKEPADSPKKDKKDLPGSTLDAKVQDVVKLIFDIKMMEHVMVEMEFDIKKMPLGKLTKKQIKEGYEVLKQIEEILKVGGKSRGEISTLSSEFYTKIPHDFGRRIPPLINDLEALKKKKNANA